ncbi:MAG: NUDIX hydrolase [Pseudomonadota bacterium]
MTHSKSIIPAVGVVCFRGEDVLLIRRGQPPMSGAWSLPGGRIEFGERAEDAALRELKEETGINAELCGLVDVVDGIFTSRRSGDVTRHYLLCDYAARWSSGEPVAGDDAADAVFVPMSRLGELDLWEETRRIIDAARALV